MLYKVYNIQYFVLYVLVQVNNHQSHDDDDVCITNRRFDVNRSISSPSRLIEL